jgi:hypothetical protein
VQRPDGFPKSLFSSTFHLWSIEQRSPSALLDSIGTTSPTEEQCLKVSESRVSSTCLTRKSLFGLWPPVFMQILQISLQRGAFIKQMNIGHR